MVCLLLSTVAQAIDLKTHYPQNYVVQPGDTLYEIAGKYLQKPWEWPLLWDANPKVRKPQKLYPGTVLKLVYVDGKPRLTRTRRGTYKLSPHARPRPAQDPIPAIHLKDIGPFLDHSLILDENELICAPYVVAFSDSRLLGSDNNQGYVQNLFPTPVTKPQLDFKVYRPDGNYKAKNDPKKIIGYKATYIADAQVIKEGQPATVAFTSLTQAVHIKDRLIASRGPEFPFDFEPQAPAKKIRGRVIDLVDAIVQVAKEEVIVIDKGRKDHLRAGDMLAIYEKPRVIVDPLSPHQDKYIKLPKERIGEAMVFRVFSQTSFALVLKSTRAINESDRVSNP
jgi:hypothetical protein